MQLKDLRPNKNNPRKMSPAKLEALRKSHDNYGDLSGFVVNKRTGNLISGHQRQKVLPPESVIKVQTYPAPTAARTVADGYILINGERFKYREVDADEVWEAEAMLAANKHSGEWDQDILRKIITETPNINIELTGFDIPSLKELNIEPPSFKEELVQPQTSPVPEAEKEDIVPEPPSIPRSKRGEVWLLGQHRVMCGDSTSSSDVELLMTGQKADLLFSDPPYGLGEKWQGGTWASNPMYAEAKKWDHLVDIHPLLKLAPEAIIWGGNYYNLPPSRCWLAWMKTQKMNTMADFELAWTNMDKCAKSWEGARNEDGKRQHPTQKPVALMEWAISFSSGSLVLDPFLGSGSTLIACERINRKCFGMEISPAYVDVILNRWAKLTGKDPIRESGSASWSSINSA